MIITLGSASPVKLAAVQAACKLLHIKAVIETVAAPSGVAEQPVGEETERGARNRALAARAHNPNSFAIGIESGLREDNAIRKVGVPCEVDGEWEDWAVIVILSPEGVETVSDSPSHPIPTYAVDAARVRGLDKTTYGDILAEMHGYDPKDPLSGIAGVPDARLHQLSRGVGEALVRQVMKQVAATLPSPLAAQHIVKLGTLTINLPIREVAPGVRVAAFDLLGDWELNELLGEKLVHLIPPGVTALVTPGGKADALLHVLGRESGLPTFVARKEHKPYMLEPVLRVPVNSITGGNARERYLHLGADAAEALRGRRVAIVDDVVSTGGTLTAMRELMKLAGAEVVAVMAVFTEGTPREDVISLGHLPLF